GKAMKIRCMTESVRDNHDQQIRGRREKTDGTRPFLRPDGRRHCAKAPKRRAEPTRAAHLSVQLFWPVRVARSRNQSSILIFGNRCAATSPKGRKDVVLASFFRTSFYSKTPRAPWPPCRRRRNPRQSARKIPRRPHIGRAPPDRRRQNPRSPAFRRPSDRLWAASCRAGA